MKYNSDFEKIQDFYGDTVSFVPIHLSHSDTPYAFAIIDEEDEHICIGKRWTFANCGYPMSLSKGKTHRLHRIIMGNPDGKEFGLIRKQIVI